MRGSSQNNKNVSEIKLSDRTERERERQLNKSLCS